MSLRLKQLNSMSDFEKRITRKCPFDLDTIKPQRENKRDVLYIGGKYMEYIRIYMLYRHMYIYQ